MAACTTSTAGTASGTSARLFLIVMLFDHIKTISGDDGHHNNISNAFSFRSITGPAGEETGAAKFNFKIDFSYKFQIAFGEAACTDLLA